MNLNLIFIYYQKIVGVIKQIHNFLKQNLNPLEFK